MSQADRKTEEALSLERLLALNDELAALVRAGIPLDQGLAALGQDMPGQLGATATRLSERMRSGETLVDILRSDESGFPPVWRAVVLAGARGGNLAAALEGWATTARHAVELRRSFAVALIYPVIVLLVAYGLFLLTVRYQVPILLRAQQDLVSAVDPATRYLAVLGQIGWAWWLLLPIVVVLLGTGWWYRSGRLVRSSAVPTPGSPRATRLLATVRPSRFPSLPRVLRYGRMATFVESLRLMHEHRVPLGEAIVLAADATGDGALRQAASDVARRLERGERLERVEDLPRGIPPLLAWSIVSAAGQSSLAGVLAMSAQVYREQATRAARWITLYLPLVLTLVVGGSAVFVQALAVFWPMTRLLFGLTQ